jgi:hypothetical protein
LDWLFLGGAGVLGGLAGSIAGLASVATYPALLLVGLPPVTANVTNTDAQVDIRSCGDVAGYRGGQLVAVQRSAVDVFDPVRTFGCGHRLTSRMRST